MKSNKWMSIGATVALVGAIALGMAYASSGVVHAGNSVPCDATSTPVRGTNLSGGNDLQAASVQQNCTETATPQRKAKTHTPTATATAEPKTATPVPPTAAPTNTPKPVQGNEGVSVKPPNTGSGDGAGSGSASLWLLVMGGAAVALGGGAFVVGVRRR